MAKSYKRKHSVFFSRMKTVFPEVHQEIIPHQSHISVTGIMTHAMPKPDMAKGRDYHDWLKLYFWAGKNQLSQMNDTNLYKYQIVLLRKKWNWMLVVMMSDSVSFGLSDHLVLSSLTREDDIQWTQPCCLANLWMCLPLSLKPILNCGQWYPG